MPDHRVAKRTTNQLARAGATAATVGWVYNATNSAWAYSIDGSDPTAPAAVPLAGFISPTFTVENVLQGAVSATAANYGEFFVVPWLCQVVSVNVRYGTASSSGTVDVKKAASGTAVGSGTSVLSATISTSTTAATNNPGSLNATAANTRLAAGDALAVVNGGTLTSLANLIVQVELVRIG